MARLTPGSRIGPFPYRIVKALDSHGGMSYVYLATDGPIDSPTSPKVIIKVSRVTQGARSFYEDTIYNESERLRNLHHRGIVRILPVKMDSDMRSVTYAARSRLPDAPWFLVLEYLRGGSVADLIEKYKRLEPALAVEIARMAAETLAFLHSQNQVHLDIKPENILFRNPYVPGGPVEPVLIDFGVARTAGQEGLEARTLPYAPPERVAVYKQNQPPETVAKPHPSMDIYSLGTVLYQMLTGKRPFEGRSNKKLSSAIMEGNPTRPSEYVSGMPRALDDIVLWAMHRDPAQRPTAAELARKLEAVAREAHLKPARVERGDGRTQRRWGRLFAATAALVVVLALGGAYWWGDGGFFSGLPNWGALISAFGASPADDAMTAEADPAATPHLIVAVSKPPTFTATPLPTPTPTRPPKSTVAAIAPTWTPLPTATPVPLPVPPTSVPPKSVPPTVTVRVVAQTTAKAAGAATSPPVRVTPTRTPTPKRVAATSTPVKPMPTPIPTQRPTAAPTATLQPGSNGTSRPQESQPTPTATPARPAATSPAGDSGGPSTISILSPQDNRTIDARVTFQWQGDAPLGPNQGYELVFYRPWEGPDAGRARDGASASSERILNLTDFGAGQYLWGVWLAQLDPYMRLRYLGGGRTLTAPEPKLSVPDEKVPAEQGGSRP